MMVRSLLFALGAWLASGAAFAADGACPNPDEVHPRLRVELQSAPIQYDETRTRADLKKFGTSTASPYAPGTATHTNGLMRGSIALESQSSLAWQGLSDGSHNCFWYEQVTLSIKLAPTIYIAREIEKDSCLYREVLAHETRHVKVDASVAKDYQAIVQDELKHYVAQVGVVGPLGANQKDAMQRKLDAALKAMLQSWSVRIQNERRLRQSQVDTLAEYERIARACPGETEEAAKP
jgi:hypothetical protein